MNVRHNEQVRGSLLALLALLAFAGCEEFGIGPFAVQGPTARFTVMPATDVTVGTLITLDGTSSSDPQSYALSYAWSVTAPPASQAQLSAANEAIVTFTPDSSGSYVVLLTVTARSQSGKADQTSRTIQVTATDAQAVAADKAALQIGYATGDSASSVTQNVVLPTSGTSGSTITWDSSAPGVVSTAGVVVRQATDTAVTMTATIVKGTASDTKSFALTVIASVLTDAEAVAADKAALQIGYAAGDSASSVTQDVTLPTAGPNGTTISWASDHPSIVGVTGVVTRPASTTDVALTATLTKGGESDTASFTLTVLAAGSIVGNWTLSTVDGASCAEAGMAQNMVFSIDQSWATVGVSRGYAFTATGTWSADGSGACTVTFAEGGPGVASATYVLDAAGPTLTTTIPDQATYVYVPGSVVLPPTGLAAVPGSGSVPSVTLTWVPSASAGVTGHRVYRGTSEGGAKDLVGTAEGSATQYADSDAALQWDSTYYYVVSAVAGEDESPIPSNEASAYAANPNDTGDVEIGIY